MALFLDEGEPHDGQDQGCGALPVRGRVEAEDLTVRTEGKWCIFSTLLLLLSQCPICESNCSVRRMKRW